MVEILHRIINCAMCGADSGHMTPKTIKGGEFIPVPGRPGKFAWMCQRCLDWESGMRPRGWNMALDMVVLGKLAEKKGEVLPGVLVLPAGLKMFYIGLKGE